MGLLYYGSKLSPNITKTPEGYLICLNVQIARIGDQQYLAKEIGLENRDPYDKVTVHRDEVDVFSEATIASFEGKPVTEDHPPCDIDLNNLTLYQKGHCQNVRRQGDYIVGDLYITDPNLINEIENNQKREVSCGYTCIYRINDDGTFNQQEIRGNHIAVVNEGRAGKTVSIKDSKYVERRTKMSKNDKSQKRSILALFARSARDAKSIEEVDNLVEDAENALSTNEPTANEPKKEEVIMQDNVTQSAENVLLGAVVELTQAIRDLKAATPIPQTPDTPNTADEEPAVIEEKENVVTTEPKEDDTMEELEKVAEDSDNAQENEDKVTVPPEEIKVEDEDKVPDTCDGECENPVKQVVQDMKPVLAMISNPKERRLVCDSLAKTLRLNVVNNQSALAKIMNANVEVVNRRVVDSKPTDKAEMQQNYYDSLNPHMRKENK